MMLITLVQHWDSFGRKLRVECTVRHSLPRTTVHSFLRRYGAWDE